MKTTKKDVLEFIKGASEDDLRELRLKMSEAWLAGGGEVESELDSFMWFYDLYNKKAKEYRYNNPCLVGGFCVGGLDGNELNGNGVNVLYIMLREGNKYHDERIEKMATGVADEINEMLNETK